MARGRMVNQTITADKAVLDLSDDVARLLFTWCIPFLDRDGRMTGEPRHVRSIIFPRRGDISVEQIAAYLAEMHMLGLVIWYFDDDAGDYFLAFPGFAGNQAGLRYDREQPSRYPPPPAKPGGPPAWSPEPSRSDAGTMPDTDQERFLRLIGFNPEPSRSDAGVMPETIRQDAGVMPEESRNDAGKMPAESESEKESESEENLKDSPAAAAPPPVPEEHPPPDGDDESEERPETDHQRTMRLFDEALKEINPRNRIKDGGASGKAVKNMLARGYTPEQIIHVWRELKARPFFERQYLSMVTVDKQIDDMLRGGSSNGGHTAHQQRRVPPELGEEIRAAHRKARA
jgi:hypothetical protein